MKFSDLLVGFSISESKSWQIHCQFLAETQPVNLFKCNSLYPKYKRRIGACQIQAIYETY